MYSRIFKASLPVFLGLVLVAMLLQACQPTPTPTPPIPTKGIPTAPIPTPTPIPLEVECDDPIKITNDPANLTLSELFSSTQNSVTPLLTPAEPITAPQHIIFLVDESLSIYSLCTQDNADLRFRAPILLISLLQAQKTIAEQKLIQVDVYAFSNELRPVLTGRTVEEYNKDSFETLKSAFEHKLDTTKSQNNFASAFEQLLKIESRSDYKPLVILISDGWTKGGKTTPEKITAMQEKYDLRMIRPVCTGNLGEGSYSKDADWHAKNYMSDAKSRENDNTLWNGIVLKSAEGVDYATMQPEDWLKALLLEEPIQRLLTYKDLVFYTQGSNPIQIPQSPNNPIWYLSLKTVQFGMQSTMLPQNQSGISVQDKNNPYIFNLNWYRIPNNYCTDSTLPEIIASAEQDGFSFGVYWLQHQNTLMDLLNTSAAEKVILNNSAPNTQTITIENNKPLSVTFDVPPLLQFGPNIPPKLAESLEQSINQCYNLVVRIDKENACKIPLPSQPAQATINLSEQSQRTDVPVTIGLAQFGKPNGKQAAFWQAKTLAIQYRFFPELADPHFEINCNTSPCTATIYLKNLQNSSKDYELKVRFLTGVQTTRIAPSITTPIPCYPQIIDDYIYKFDNTQYYQIDEVDQSSIITDADTIKLDLLPAYGKDSCTNNDIEYIYLRWQHRFNKNKHIDLICKTKEKNSKNLGNYSDG